MGKTIKAKDFPEFRHPDYLVGYSCRALTKSHASEESCGVFFKTILNVLKAGFKLPITEEGKV